MEIHIQLAGIQLGPYSEKQIRDYIAEGLLSMTDKAREEGTAKWIEVSELMAKLPPAPEAAPPPDPDAVFVPDEAITSAPTERLTQAPASTPAGATGEPRRAPDAAPGVSHLPTRVAEPNKSAPLASDPLTAKTKPLGPVSPTATAGPPKGITASSSTGMTAPLIQTNKKLSRTALARALQNRTEPMPSRSGVSSPVAIPAGPGPLEPVPAATPAPVVPPETTGPMAPGAAEPAPVAVPETRKGAGLPSLMKALTAKTVPMRTGATIPPPPAPSAPPLPGGSSNMPVTTPLPTRAIINPMATRAPRQNPAPAPAPPTAPPSPPEVRKATEKLPSSKKAAELRAKAAERTTAALTETKPERAPVPGPAPATEPAAESSPDPEIERVPEAVEPRPPRKRSYRVLLYPLGLLILAGAYYAWSPYHASAALRDAMATGNAVDLANIVDFTAVRDGLKQQAPTLAVPSGAPGSPAPSDAVTMLDNSIDLYVTPNGVSTLVTKQGDFRPADVSQSISSDVAAGIVNAFVTLPVHSQQLASPTDFVLETDAATMHLTLEGISWKLTRIDVQSDLPVPAGSDAIPVALIPVVQTYLDRAQAAADNNAWNSAVADCSQALAIDPRSTAALSARGLARLSSGDPDGAIKDYTQALAISPQMATAFTGRGNARVAKNDLDGAIADFTQAVTIDPTMAVAYDGRGNAKTAKDDLDGAIRDFTQAITIDPSLASAYSDRGFARQANGNLEGAIKDYTDALNLKKTAKTYFSRGLAWLSQNNLEAAILDFNRALSVDPKIADAYFQRGNAKSALHDTDGAIADFTQTLALNPKNALAYCSRGVAREDKGDLDGALADYTQSLTIDPKVAIAYFRRALIELRKNNLDGAIGDASQAIDLDPKNAQAYYYRGFAKLVRGNYDGATADLKTFCEAAPRDRFADNARLYLWLIGKQQNAHIDADQDLSDALENSWNNSADDFTAKTAAFLLGRVTEADYLGAAASIDGEIDASQHCQAWYFAGMKRLLVGDKATATDYFKRCLATGKKDFCEYILAHAEMQSMVAPPTAPAPAAAPNPVGAATAPGVVPLTSPPVAIPTTPPAPAMP